MIRYAVPGPLLESRREGVVHDFLGQVEVADEANQRGQDPARLSAVEALDRHQAARSTIGRTSIEPIRTEGMRAAIAVASSRFGASIM